MSSWVYTQFFIRSPNLQLGDKLFELGQEGCEFHQKSQAVRPELIWSPSGQANHLLGQVDEIGKS